MSTTGVPAKRFEPVQESPFTDPFWDATRDRRLVLPWCTACGSVIWFPRPLCPSCAGSTVEWREASGRGEVYAASVQHGREGRHVVALVTLEEGARLMTNVVGCDPDEVRVGSRVQVTWEGLSDGRHLPLFRPQGGEEA